MVIFFYGLILIGLFGSMIGAFAQPTQAPQPDPNKEITLTYGELTRLVESNVLHALANQKAEDVMKKLQLQLNDGEKK